MGQGSLNRWPLDKKKNLLFQIHFEMWYLSCSCCWWLALYTMAFWGDLNRRAQCSNPLKVLQVAIELSKNGFLQREGKKGSFLLPVFKNWSHHALYIWRFCHCPLLYDCLVIQAG